MMNIERRMLITTAASLLAMPSIVQAKKMSRAEEQAAAKIAAKQVAQNTGEEPHIAAGAILSLPHQIHTLDGKNLNTHQYDNKVLMIYFWASWCPICKIVAPQLQEFWQAKRSKGIELLGVASKDTEANAKTMANQRNYRFPVAMAADLKLPATFAPRSLPTIMLRSKLGVILTVEEGDVNSEEMNEFLAHL
jgi:thiol-disulfide isomerase/thioredoxin